MKSKSELSPDLNKTHYAKVTWTVGDVQAVFDVSDAEAKSFLEQMERTIQDQMISTGWDAIEILGARQGWKRID